MVRAPWLSRVVGSSIAGACLVGLVGSLAVSLGVASPVRAQETSSEPEAVARFRALLAPHGTWLTVPRHGEVFVPREAAEADFVPYLSGGHWESSRRGPTFVSRYPWGEVCFHQGRWVRLGSDASRSEAGRWAWVPDEEWSSAWVEWRTHHGDVTWRARSPEGARAGERAPWAVVPRTDLARADVAQRALRVSDAAVASFAPSSDGTQAATSETSTPRVPRGQVMLSGGGTLVVHDRGGDRVVSVAPVIVDADGPEAREAQRRERAAELARERAAEDARVRADAEARARIEAEAHARVEAERDARVAAAAPAPSTATASSSATTTTTTSGTRVGYGVYLPYGYGYGGYGSAYGSYGYGYGGYGGAYGYVGGYAGGAASAPAAPTSGPVDSYAPPRFSAPRMPFGGYRW